MLRGDLERLHGQAPLQFSGHAVRHPSIISVDHAVPVAFAVGLVRSPESHQLSDLRYCSHLRMATAHISKRRHATHQRALAN